MSFITSLGNIVRVIGRVGSVAYGLLKTVIPVLESLRPAVDEIDTAFEFIEDKIAKGGIEADDFLDRNLGAIVAVENLSGKGIAVFQQMNTVAVQLRLASQEQTPDTITPEEAQQIGEAFLEFRTLFKSWGVEMDNAVPLLKAAIADEA